MRQALVHPTICGRDFEAVKPGSPLLATFAGYDIHWNGKEEIYPHFINESTYNKANIAMVLAKKGAFLPCNLKHVIMPPLA